MKVTDEIEKLKEKVSTEIERLRISDVDTFTARAVLDALHWVLGELVRAEIRVKGVENETDRPS